MTTIENRVQKRLPILLITFLLIGCLISCNQEHQKEALRVGAYYTEEQAKANLVVLSKNYTTDDHWRARAQEIRHNIYQGAGLNEIADTDWDHNIAVTRVGKKQMDGYSVENIALEVKPGYFITGNLYQPDSVYGKVPAILCPHGHWHQPDDYGRFRDDMQLRCASFARMGAVVFAYDMYGYGEDIQHYHKDQSALKWQTYNGIRILDFVSQLSHVDTTRIAITGASGGGTQSFVLAAIDHRIDVSAPVVMVSAHFFGGCVCESGLPIHKNGNYETNNVEIAASIAPKPLLLVSDGDDWTKNVPEVEFPYVRNIYEMFDAEENVQYAHFENEVHDYGPSKRKPVYKFFADHLRLDIKRITDENGEIDESFVHVRDTTALKVFPYRSLVRDPYVYHLKH